MIDASADGEDGKGESLFTAYEDEYPETPGLVVQYAYDFGNRWMRRIVDPEGTNEQTIFVYDGPEASTVLYDPAARPGQIALQFENSGGDDLEAGDLTHRYLWGPAVDQILADEQTSGQSTAGDVLWPLCDHLGTVRDLAAYDSGTTTIDSHRVYDAFGNVTNGPITDSHPFAFTARPLDIETGLQNNLHRWYDAAVGRWLSEDPIGFHSRDVNLYRYVANVPGTAIDFFGLASLRDIVCSRGTLFPDPLDQEAWARAKRTVQVYEEINRVLEGKNGEYPLFFLARTHGERVPAQSFREIKAGKDLGDFAFMSSSMGTTLATVETRVLRARQDIEGKGCPCVGVLELSGHFSSGASVPGLPTLGPGITVGTGGIRRLQSAPRARAF